MKENKKKQYPEQHEGVVKQWSHDGACFTIIKIPGRHYCGYARFDVRPVKESGYNGILTYVPVHGGITYAGEDEHGMVYGFDCAHVDDDEDPKCQDVEWIGEQCGIMAKSIQVAARHEDAYLSASDEEKAAVVDAYHKELAELGIAFNLQDNFGAMINVLCGRL